jgi:c-di-GMP-binding flagellar brake protein YcgR
MDKEMKVNPTPEWQMPGQRKFSRVDLSAGITFRPTLHGMQVGHPIEAEILDISLGGLMFKSAAVLESGAHLHVRINLAEILSKDVELAEESALGSTELVAEAQIRQVKERLDGTMLYGIEFTNIERGDMQSLESFIKKYS